MSLFRRISGDFRHLCKPAMVYLAISVVALVAIAYQNMGLSNMYCMGDFSCYVPSTSAVIFSEGLYILFWTWILNLMCRTGYASISWFMVVFPLVLFFVLIGLMMLASTQMTRQGRVKQMLPIERPARVREGVEFREDRRRPRDPKISQIDRQRRQPTNLMQSDLVQVDTQSDEVVPVQVDTMRSVEVLPAQVDALAIMGHEGAQFAWQL